MSLTLPPLPYALDALEPYISRRTLSAHHRNCHTAYAEKARVLTQRTPLESAPLEEVVHASASQDDDLINAAAQARQPPEEEPFIMPKDILPQTTPALAATWIRR